MQILVILGHPQKGSFNHAIADVTIQALQNKGHSFFFHDLYEEKFDPILPRTEIPNGASLDPVIQKHCSELSSAEGIIIIHPNWWGQPPAILKGWVDRVIRSGVAYKFAESDSGDGVPIGLLKAKSVLVFNTSDTPQERELKVFGDPLETLWKNCIWGLCGIENFYRKTYGVIITSTLEQRKAWLEDVRETVNFIY